MEQMKSRLRPRMAVWMQVKEWKKSLVQGTHSTLRMDTKSLHLQNTEKKIMQSYYS